MPRFTVAQLLALSNSELVKAPEFKWHDFERAAAEAEAAHSYVGHHVGSHGHGHHHGFHHGHGHGGHHYGHSPSNGDGFDHPHRQRPRRNVAPASQLVKDPATAGEHERKNENKFQGLDPDEIDLVTYLGHGEHANRPSHADLGVPVKYAASLAASHADHPSQPRRSSVASVHSDLQAGQQEDHPVVFDEDEAGEDGWIAVTREPKPRRKSQGRRRSSASHALA